MAPSDKAQEGFHHGKNSIGHRRVQRHRRMVAQELKSAGFKVYAAARRVDRMADLEKDGITPVALDLTRDGSIAACVNTILSKEKSIDVLVNNAGYGSYGAIEDVPLEEGRRQFEVNLFGMARLIRLVTPAMREQHYEKIVSISSMGGKIWTKFGGWYHATKYAVEGLSDCLRMELQSFGIDVVVVEPGGIKTDWGLITAENLKKRPEGGLRMTNFLIGRAYRDYLSAMGFCVEQVLKKAGLPEDLFARQAPCLGAEEYFRFLQPGRADLPAAAGAVQAADRRAFISRRRDRDGAQRGARIRPRGAGASGDPRWDRVRFPRRADPQGDAGAGHAAVRCSKAAGEEPRLRGVSRRAHHAGRAGPARFSGRFPRGRARPSAKAVSRVSDGFAVRRVGTLNQAFGR